MKTLTDQEKRCYICCKLGENNFPFCHKYMGYIKSGILSIGDRCPEKDEIEEDLQKIVLGYDGFGPIAEKLMENCAKE